MILDSTVYYSNSVVGVHNKVDDNEHKHNRNSNISTYKTHDKTWPTRLGSAKLLYIRRWISTKKTMFYLEKSGKITSRWLFIV